MHVAEKTVEKLLQNDGLSVTRTMLNVETESKHGEYRRSVQYSENTAAGRVAEVPVMMNAGRGSDIEVRQDGH